MAVKKNMLLPKAKGPVAPSTPLGPVMGDPFRERGGKMKPMAGKKAKRVAEKVPTGPMKGF